VWFCLLAWLVFACNPHVSFMNVTRGEQVRTLRARLVAFEQLDQTLGPGGTETELIGCHEFLHISYRAPKSTLYTSSREKMDSYRKMRKPPKRNTVHFGLGQPQPS
jgi:hypothetical protein